MLRRPNPERPRTPAGVRGGLGRAACWLLPKVSRPTPRTQVATLLRRTVLTKHSILIVATTSFIAFASAAHARSAYDGSWDLLFVTQRGACDSSYSFTVNVSNGIVTHPNLVRFRGYVAKSGSVRASVTVQDKYASGAGRLAARSGRGTWSGHSGLSHCFGYWTAQRH